MNMKLLWTLSIAFAFALLSLTFSTSYLNHQDLHRNHNILIENRRLICKYLAKSQFEQEYNRCNVKHH